MLSGISPIDGADRSTKVVSTPTTQKGVVFMTTQLSEGSRSMGRLMTKRITTLAVLFGLSLVTIAGCSGSDGGDGSVTVPPIESNGSESEEEPVTPDYGSDESAEPEYGSGESVEPGYGSDESAIPDQPSTNPCAFPGDPLCPDTPVKVPPPDISNWP
jgi:hypothetical protein